LHEQHLCDFKIPNNNTYINKRWNHIRYGEAMDAIMHLSVMEEWNYTSILSISYFPLECSNALNERCDINRSLYQKMFQGLQCTFKHPWILLYLPPHHQFAPICTLSTSSMGSFLVASSLSSNIPIVSSTIGVHGLFRFNSYS
jgi:hypothetical protein